MRNIFKLSLLALFVGFTSCEDATDIVQESELNDDAAYQTVTDLQTGLNGVYAAYSPDSGSNGTGDVIVFNELFTDGMKKGSASSGQGNQEYGFILQPNSDFPIRIWGNRYGAINFANRVLRAYDRLAPTFSPTDLQTANRIKGQLLAMRALCHFDLLQYFTEDYDNPAGLSVIIMDFVPEITDYFERNTTGEVFEFINNDLAEATQLLGSVNSGDVFYINQDAVKAIKARVALFQGDYATAGTLADELLADFPIATAAQYPTVWDDTFTQEGKFEVIFALARLQGDAQVGSLFAANESDITGSPFYEMSNELYDLYGSTDIRKELFVDPTSEPANGILIINKYPGGQFGGLTNHIKLFRSSEMLLISAEAQARANNLAGANDLVNELADERNAAAIPAYSTLNEALTSILLERRKELCFEGHRYVDLKRLGRELNIGVNRDPRDYNTFGAPCCLGATDYRWTLPIPRTELSANPIITQNTGY